MPEKSNTEFRKELQLTRLSFFSDAVFAIAITLLALEVKLPEFKSQQPSEMDLVHALVSQLPKFIGFLISFFLIGFFWTVHHHLFGYVINYTRKLLWLNLFLLFTIIIMPYNTAFYFYSEYIMKHTLTPVIFYSGNIILLGISNLLIWKYVGDPRHQLNEGLTKEAALYYSLRAVTFPVIFTVTAFLYLIVPRFAIFIPVLTFFVLRLIFRPMKKKISKEST